MTETRHKLKEIKEKEAKAKEVKEDESEAKKTEDGARGAEQEADLENLRNGWFCLNQFFNLFLSCIHSDQARSLETLDRLCAFRRQAFRRA